jgi:hypothetical protein
MKYVILRDDDTNALTPIDYLERLFRPFLDRGFPVNLATIPNVNTEALHCDGELEVFNMTRTPTTPKTLPIGCNEKLVDYLKSNPCYQIVQHGCRHEFVSGKPEFAHDNGDDIRRRIKEGRKFLLEAGFPEPTAFVAPYDQLSQVSYLEVTRQFPVLSTGWFEWRRVPRSWWPQYLMKKLTRSAHWRVGNNILLTHPGCHLSYHRNYGTMLDEIRRSIDSRRVTVLVSHWWEYFRNRKADDALISVLHETADYLAKRNDVRVISFADLTRQSIELN